MMLKEYCKGQPIAYNILKNEIENNKIAHAYLLSADSVQTATSFAFAFAKTLLCPNNNLEQKECGNCTICQRLDNGNFPELKIIEPDGLWIKKDQLIELQEEFKMKPLEGNNKIYIIKEADKLNTQAANSILKFLEDPEPNIIAILTTGDVHNVLDTIVSRCQLIYLKEKNIDYDSCQKETIVKIGMLYNKKDIELQQFIEEPTNILKLDAIINFIKKYENSKYDVILEMKKLWFDYFTEKCDYIWALDIMALFYKDVLNIMYNRQLELFNYYEEAAKYVASRNKIEKILHKMQKILLVKEKVKYNINLSLLMDKLILEMESGEYV